MNNFSGLSLSKLKQIFATRNILCNSDSNTQQQQSVLSFGLGKMCSCYGWIASVRNKSAKWHRIRPACLRLLGPPWHQNPVDHASGWYLGLTLLIGRGPSLLSSDWLMSGPDTSPGSPVISGGGHYASDTPLVILKRSGHYGQWWSWFSFEPHHIIWFTDFKSVQCNCKN